MDELDRIIRQKQAAERARAEAREAEQRAYQETEDQARKSWSRSSSGALSEAVTGRNKLFQDNGEPSYFQREELAPQEAHAFETIAIFHKVSNVIYSETQISVRLTGEVWINHYQTPDARGAPLTRQPFAIGDMDKAAWTDLLTQIFKSDTGQVVEPA